MKALKAKMLPTDAERLKRAFEQMELQFPGISARVDYLCCDKCAAQAMEMRGCKTYLAVSGERMNEAFQPVFHSSRNLEDCESLESTEALEVQMVGREPDMRAPIKVIHKFISNDMETRREVVSLLNEYGFLVQWDFSDKEILILHDSAVTH